MRKFSVLFLVLLLSGFVASGAWADAVLFEYAFNKDGAITTPSLPSAFDPLTGTATYNVTITGAGSHYFAAYFDYELSEGINGFTNEYGANFGTPASGQSWEIDEPGYVFGDIYTNFTAGALDNTNSVPSTAPDDVSMALGWDFDLIAGQTATITVKLAYNSPPAGGFYLQQTDPASQEDIYFSSSIDVGSGQPGVPEPATLMLLGSGLAGLLGFRKKFRK